MKTDSSQSTLAKLAEILAARKQANPEESYVASLHAQGLNKILEKIGEEAIECVLAAKDCDIDNSAANQRALIGETADLWFHNMVMLSELDLDYNDVLNELEARFGLSGLEEKASRSR